MENRGEHRGQAKPAGNDGGGTGRRRGVPFSEGFLDTLRARVSLHEIAGRHVRWDTRKSNPGRRDWWACCPFHQEKTPSFHVDDAKGFYHCFGCGASGDTIKFVMEAERLSYPQAVRRLAEQAGLPMPNATPQTIAAEEREEARRQRIRAALECASDFFRAQLHMQNAAASAAREHLRQRGFTPEEQSRFALGFAPPSSAGEGNRLLHHMRQASFSNADMLDAGLIAVSEGKGEDGRRAYDRFRNRIIFPIHDANARLIAFGGRALSPQDRAKYLNSPESALFKKREILYNLHRAREPARKAQSILLVEGYTDVVAMSRFGFAHVVAPLGTALGDAQIALLWRQAAEPILCFDGDEAGMRAAGRTAELLLERLKPGYSMRFAQMPPGQDPEDVLQRGGREAMERILQDALPLDELLWRKEVEGGEWRTPERRAQLQQRLYSMVRRIQDRRVRGFYESAVRERLRNLFYGGAQRVEASLETRRSAHMGEGEQSRRAQRLLLYLAFRFSELAERNWEDLAHLDIRDRETAAVRDLLLTALTEEQSRPPSLPPPDSDSLRGRLRDAGLENFLEEFESAHWSSPMIAEGVHRADFTQEQGAALWRHVHERERKNTIRREEIPAAASELAALAQTQAQDDAESLRQLRALHEELDSAQGNETRFADISAKEGKSMLE